MSRGFRRGASVIGALLLLLIPSAVLANVNGLFEGYPVVKVRVNGVELSPDVPGINFKGRTLVPVRAITDALGATLSWDSATWTADIRSSAVASAAGGAGVSGGGAAGGAGGSVVGGASGGGVLGGAAGGSLEDRVAALESKVADLTTRLDQAMATIAQLQSAGTSGSSSGTTTSSAGSTSGSTSAPTGTAGTGTITTPVFPGFFKDVSYDNPALFLQTGQQTKATPVILNAAASIPNKSGIDGVAVETASKFSSGSGRVWDGGCQEFKQGFNREVATDWRGCAFRT